MPNKEIFALTKYARCDSCPLKGQPLVPGDGIMNPDIAFVAEAPGETEVEEGIPLIGKSGQFLRKLIDDVGIDQNKCYFTNACLCRPPENKTPNATAVKSCSGRLVRELASVKPKLIVTLGK